jgi:hypothetical protein
VMTNPSSGESELRFLQLVQSNTGGSLSGSYIHPAGNSESLSGSITATGSVNLALNTGSIIFSGSDLDGNGLNSADARSLKLLVTGGSANGLTLTFTRR